MSGRDEARERAFWILGPGRGAIREEPRREPGPGDVRVRTRYSGISRGTEGLVFRGEVPPSEFARMRAPHQEGDFPGPVKYGYLNVGVVEAGPDALRGRTVFALAPHQTASVLPADAVVPLPEAVPARRAVLAGLVETALNALWDVPLRIGDAVTVIGAGPVGCCIALLAARHPAARVTLVDVDEHRRAAAGAVGARFAVPEEAAFEQDVVFHASATAAGLRTGLELLRTEGTLVDVSWYGTRSVELPLGGAFHARRLLLRSSQVGLVAPERRSSRSTRDRLGLAVALLADPAFDALLTDHSRFEDLPRTLAAIAGGRAPGIGHVVEYEED
ncbi:MAG: zinc-dependent alcohol dehydrogenase [Amnibacterium sp.]